MSTQTLEFFFDVGSPASYLAWTQLPKLCQETGAKLVWRPMLLGGVFKDTGNASPAMVPAKGAYMLQDLARHARRYGVSFKPNPHFPINTLQLMRAIAGIQLRAPKRFQDLVTLIFQAMWVHGLNLNDPAVIDTVLEQGGFATPEVFALAQAPAAKDALKAHTEEAVRRGVFGAPTFFVGQDMFFGQDRLDFVREALLTSN